MENSQMENIYNLNGGDLAFVGDAYYSLRIREYLIKKGNTKLDALHKLESLYVSRFGQEKAVDAIMPYLKEDEEEIYKRGRNFDYKKKSSEYVKASGFEAIIGYLYLKKDFERLDFIIEKAISSVEK